MEQSKLLMMKPQLGAYFFSLLAVFAGVFALRGDLMGKASPEVLPVPVEEVAADAATEADRLPASQIEAILRAPQRAAPISPALIDSETLWLARCIFSETKRPEEQELVAWVIRNRVDTGYRGQHTYRDVVLDPYQFSAFNPGTRTRLRYLALGPDAQVPGWRRALAIAYAVRHADAARRPFSGTTRHFYSERSMVGASHPAWAAGLHPVKPRRPVELDAKRFRFFEDVN
ncbi:MAG: cell wall hydrolase [Rhodothermales bacterium]|nr:cell wall hydrolase [Rhodothermales bacterium]